MISGHVCQGNIFSFRNVNVFLIALVPMDIVDVHQCPVVMYINVCVCSWLHTVSFIDPSNLLEWSVDRRNVQKQAHRALRVETSPARVELRAVEEYQ